MLDALLARLWRRSFRRGFAGEGWPWMALGAAAYLLHRARRDTSGPLESLTLRPGDSVVVRVSEPTPPRDRRDRRGRRQRERTA